MKIPKLDNMMKAQWNRGNIACITNVSEMLLVKIEVDEKVRIKSGKTTTTFKMIPNQERLHNTGLSNIPVK